MAEVDIYENQAKSLVDAVIDKALSHLENELSSNNLADTSRQSTFLSMQDDYEHTDIKWLSIDEFTIDRGEKKILEFIKTWTYETSWLFCVDFLGQDDFDFDTRYRYRVRWSVPTRRKPIPRATACVYFTFDVSKIKPKHFPVEVFYVFETNHLVHRPGHSRFREQWLKDIIENKVLMMEAVAF